MISNLKENADLVMSLPYLSPVRVHRSFCNGPNSSATNRFPEYQFDIYPGRGGSEEHFLGEQLAPLSRKENMSSPTMLYQLYKEGLLF